jgi:membrane-associated phospholipid phosphatase
MGAVLQEWNQWGIAFIVALQARTGGALDVAFTLITGMGDELFYLILLPFLFWCVGKRQGIHIAALLTNPRPFVVSADVIAKVEATGYSFPSGHAQNAAVIWPALAFMFRRRWVAALAVVCTVLIAISRVYLGVHYPHDIIVGALVGLLIAYVYVRHAPALEERVARWGVGWQLAVVLFLTLVLSFSLTSDDALTLGGSVCGIGLGYVLEQRTLRFQPKANWRSRLLSLGLGMIIVAAVYVGMKAVAPTTGDLVAVALRFVRYMSVGFVAVYVVPWVLVKASLADAPTARAGAAF